MVPASTTTGPLLLMTVKIYWSPEQARKTTCNSAVLTSLIKAVDSYAGLIRASAATAGNDHRLGRNEAPPAIISRTGEQLQEILSTFQPISLPRDGEWLNWA